MKRWPYRIVPSAEERTIARHSNTSHGDVVLRDELVSALVFAQIPDTHVASTITAN